MISYEQVRAWFFYDSKTGILRWKKIEGRRKTGPLGSPDSKGYLVIHIRPKMYRLHRIIWLWKTGFWPVGEIDHKNGIRADNKWKNLREATHLENCHNSKRYSSKSGIKGVHWRKDLAKYAAVIHVRGKKLYLGFDKDPKKAAAMYKKAAEQYFGEFARTS